MVKLYRFLQSTSLKLARDFRVLAGIICGLFLVFCAFYLYHAWWAHTQKIAQTTQSIAEQISHTLVGSLNYAEFLMTHVGQKIVESDPHNIGNIKNILAVFRDDAKMQSLTTWSGFSWANANHELTVSSLTGIVRKPLSISTRSYIAPSKSTPWKIHLSPMTKGLVSGLPIIPAGLGITDNSGRFVGTVTMGFEVSNLQSKLEGVRRLEGVWYGVYEHETGNLIFGKDLRSLPSTAISIASVPNAFEIVVGYDAALAKSQIWTDITPRLIEIGVFALVLGMVLLSIHRRVVQPAIHCVSEKEILEKIMLAKSRQARNLVHDLRAHASIVITFADIISQNHYERDIDPQYVAYANDIQRSGTQILDMVNEILDLEKARHGQLELEPKAIDVPSLLTHVGRYFENKAILRGIAIRMEAPANMPEIYADPKRLRRMVQNLLNNSLKFTKRGGSICVSYLLDEEERPVIRVTDTGKGMTSEEITVALTEYGQVTNDDASQHDSSGIGLPFVKQMMEEHGGHMEIESEPGKGTTVSLIFDAQDVRHKKPKLTLIMST